MAYDFDHKEFVDAYFGYSKAEDESLFWSWEVFYDGWDRCDEKYALMMLLLEAAPDDPSVDLVAAGPLEDVLWHCGDAVIDRIEVEAQANPRMIRALAGVWGLERYPAIEARVDRIVGRETSSGSPDGLAEPRKHQSDDVVAH